MIPKSANSKGILWFSESSGDHWDETPSTRIFCYIPPYGQKKCPHLTAIMNTTYLKSSLDISFQTGIFFLFQNHLLMASFWHGNCSTQGHSTVY